MADEHKSQTDLTNQQGKTLRLATLSDIEKNVITIANSVKSNDRKSLARVLRSNTLIRHTSSGDLLQRAITTLLPKGTPNIAIFLELASKIEPISIESQTQEEERQPLTTQQKSVIENALPEVEVYLFLLVVSGLLRQKLYEDAAIASHHLFQRIRSLNRRTLDLLSSKVYFYYSESFKALNRLSEIRSGLIAAHRTACLRHDDMTRATLINLILRIFIHYNAIDQASKFYLNSNFPEQVSNNQFCRFLYYTGRIHAIQLEYSEAHMNLSQSLRKAPQNTAFAFRLTVLKLTIIVQLLMGEIPERSTFNQKGFTSALVPYLKLTTAVRLGDLHQFNSVVQEHTSVFQADKNFTLILRLKHNVIKTGLRRISLSYSRISLQDIAQKLQLESDDNVTLIVAKAIRDGVIDATIDHETQVMQSKDIVDVYSTMDPRQAFHKRITFCLDIHNEAVKAMRYPQNLNKKQAPDVVEIVPEVIEAELFDDMDDDI